MESWDWEISKSISEVWTEAAKVHSHRDAIIYEWPLISSEWREGQWYTKHVRGQIAHSLTTLWFTYT